MKKDNNYNKDNPKSCEIFHKTDQKSMICFLELSKFAAKSNVQFKDIIFADERERWAYFLKNLGTMELQDLTGVEWMFREMFEDSLESKLTKNGKEAIQKECFGIRGCSERHHLCRGTQS